MNFRHVVQRMLLLFLTATAAVAQQAFVFENISLSKESPRWGDTVTVDYEAPDGSSVLAPGTRDTVYFVPDCEGYHGAFSIVLPMHRTVKNLFETTFRVPDSISSYAVKIMTPRRSLLRYWISSACQDRNGRATRGNAPLHFDNDSASCAYRAMFPDDYFPFANKFVMLQQMQQISPDSTLTPALLDSMMESTLRDLRANARPSLSRLVVLALLEFLRQRTDTAGAEFLREAAAYPSWDPILENGAFWSYHWTPHDPALLPLVGYRWRMLAPLAARFPSSTFASQWLANESGDSLLDTIAFRAIESAAGPSPSYGTLKTFGDAYASVSSPMHDPVKAMGWYDRALNAYASNAGFYSGADVEGGRGYGLRELHASRSSALLERKRVDEAIAEATIAVATDDDGNDWTLRSAHAALGRAYLAAGRIHDAERSFGQALPVDTSDALPRGFDELFVTCHRPNESIRDYAAHLRSTYPVTTPLAPIRDFSFVTMDSVRSSLYALRGRVVVLDFWFLGCMGCMLEREALNRLHDEFASDTSVAFLSIALTDDASLRSFFSTHPTKWPTVASATSICDAVGIGSFPTHLIIGRDGATRFRDTGGSETSDSVLRPKIKEALTAE